MTFASHLVARWAAAAEVLAQYGAQQEARTLDRCVEELQLAEREWQEELLSQKQAADEAGVSTSTIRRWERDGKVENRGSENAPRYRRRDVLAGPCEVEGWSGELIDVRT